MLMLLFVACKQSDVPQPQPGAGEVALVFSTNAADRSTRAASGTLLHDLNYQTFGIWTWRTLSDDLSVAAPSDWLPVMEHYHVSYDGKYNDYGREENGWGYDKETNFPTQALRYWNLSSTHYEFKGYAPWVGEARSESDADPYVEVDASRNLVYHNVGGHFRAQDMQTAYPVSSDPDYATKKSSVDWLYTYCGRQLAPVPSSPALLDHDNTLPSSHVSYYIGNTDYTLSKTVPLRFHHLLPKVIFRLHVYDPEDPMLSVNEVISVSVKTHDKFPTKAGEVSYQTAPYSSSTTASATAEFVETDGTAEQQWTTELARVFSKTDGTDYQDISPVAADGTRQGWLELPQPAPVFDVKLRFHDEDYVRRLDPATDVSLSQIWQPDHIYVYVINFNVKSLALEVTSYMEEWSSTFDDFQITDW